MNQKRQKHHGLFRTDGSFAADRLAEFIMREVIASIPSGRSAKKNRIVLASIEHLENALTDYFRGDYARMIDQLNKEPPK